ncbi:MAG: hypothetical protein HZB38_00580 [Planctomycetes bacterium]|nr:hypothetical protein [Planctomycetota bacterium]
MKRWRHILIGAALAAIIAGGLFVVLRPRIIAEVRRSRLTARLASSDPLERSRVAWSLAENPDPFLMARLVQNLMGDEPDSGAREACVYALGRSGDKSYLPAVRFSIEAHQAGCVRAAGWLALARLDPDEFRHREKEGPAVGDAWDAIGLAQARLAVGDLSDAEVLLRFAERGDDAQRYVCTQAMWKHIRPLLEAAGRWPLDASVHEGESWPPEFAHEVAERALRLDLPALREHIQRHWAATESLRQTVRRLNGARERMTAWLFPQNNASTAASEGG